MTFKPILKSIIWGGSDICPFKGITPVQEGIGESWELSHVEGNYSIVDNGALEGKTLDELIRTYGKQLLGEKVVEQFGSTFSLLMHAMICLSRFIRMTNWLRSVIILSARQKCGM